MTEPSQPSPRPGIDIGLDVINSPAAVQYDLSPAKCGGWLGRPGASPGRWSFAMDGQPWTALEHLPEDARLEIEGRITRNSGSAPGDFLKLVSRSLRPYDPGPAAVILFPRDMDLAIHVCQARNNLADFMFSGYWAGRGSAEERSVPSVSVLAVYDIERFLAIPDDGGLIKQAQRTLEGAIEGVRWICLAEEPDRDWIGSHASGDLKLYNALRQRAVAAIDLRWQSNPRGALLHSLVTNHFQTSSPWIDKGRHSFVWWPGILPQIIQTDTVVQDGSRLLVPVLAETYIAEGCDAGEEAAAMAMGYFNGESCGLSAMVWDPDTHVVRMSTRQAVVMPEAGRDLSWFGARAVLQSRDAHDFASGILARVGGKLMDSAAPGMPLRGEPDHALGSLERNCSPTIGAWNPYTHPLETGIVESRLSSAGAIVERHGLSIFASVKWHGGTAVVMVEPVGKSRAGSGAWVTLRLPLTLPPAKAAILANRLNNSESRSILPFAMAGAWQVLPIDGREYTVGFVAFLPSSHYAPGFMGVEASAQVQRLEWVDIAFVY